MLLSCSWVSVFLDRSFFLHWVWFHQKDHTCIMISQHFVIVIIKMAQDFFIIPFLCYLPAVPWLLCYQYISMQFINKSTNQSRTCLLCMHIIHTPLTPQKNYTLATLVGSSSFKGNGLLKTCFVQQVEETKTRRSSHLNIWKVPSSSRKNGLPL